VSIPSIALYGAEPWTPLRKTDHKYQENFEMWCWWRMEKIHWTDRVRNEVLLTVEERNILRTVKRRKGNWIGHILRRNCLLKDVIQEKVVGKIEVTGRWISRKHVLYDLKETTAYWKLKEEALDFTFWRTCFRRAYGPVIRQTTERTQL